MNRPNTREIERRLASQPAPPPPAELLERIRSEIPESSEIWPEEAPASTPGPRRWLIAASLIVAVGGGLLGYRTLREVEVDRLEEPVTLTLAPAQPAGPSEGEAAPPAPETTETPGTSEAPESAAGAVEQALVERPDRIEDRLAAEPPPAAPSERAGGPASSVRLLERLEREVKKIPIPDPTPDENEAPRTLAAPPPPSGEPEVVTVISESPLLDARAVRPNRTRAQEAPKPLSSLGYLGPPEALVVAPPSTGGTDEPNDAPYGDVFYREYGVNPFIDTEDDRFSTFGLDVDTGSYSITRRYLDDGNVPPREAVRIEEFLNYFDYRDAPPERGDFALHAELAPAPFATGERYQVLRFGIRGRVVDPAQRKPATLIFVVDVSGSMGRENRLGLVIRSLILLLDQLRSDDRVGLVVYGSQGQVLLEPSGDHEAIRDAIERLRPGGSTNAEEGLLLAYEQASRFFREGAINRIVLCSDGVANVGRTGPDSILERVRREAERGIELTTVGFGMGNYNDVLMEQLADKGNGRYAYVDDLAEARRIFVENLTGTLQTIASDAKVQVEFNPEVVSRYRLLGYENRDIADERFRDDSVDAGEIGSGHSVTALYEVKLQEKRPKRAPLATLHLRYRSQETREIVEIERSIAERDGADNWRNAPPALKLAAVVAEFGEILKGSYWAKDGDLARLLESAQELSPEFAGDEEVAELVGLIAKASRLRAGEGSGTADN